MDEQVGKKKRVVSRFSAGCDVALLKTILEQNPYDSNDAASSWKALAPIVSNLCGKQFTPRGVKERSEFLLDKHKAKDLEDLKKSGTEEEFSEREALLPEVVRLRAEFNIPPKGERPKKKEVEEGKLMRMAAAQSMSVEVYEEGCNVEQNSMLFETVDDDVDMSPDSGSLSAALTPPPSSQSSNVDPIATTSRPHSMPAPSVSTPHPKRKKPNFAISEHLKQIRARELELEFEKVQVEKMRLENERRRIALEEARNAREERRVELQEAKDTKILELLDALIHQSKEPSVSSFL